MYISSGQFHHKSFINLNFFGRFGVRISLNKTKLPFGGPKTNRDGLVSVAINCLDLILNLSYTLRISIHWTKTRDVSFPPQKQILWETNIAIEYPHLLIGNTSTKNPGSSHFPASYVRLQTGVFRYTPALVFCWSYFRLMKFLHQPATKTNPPFTKEGS